MIVVDTNIIVPLWLRSAQSEPVDHLLEIDAEWYAPYLWRSEFRNAMALQLRHRRMSLDEAKSAMYSAQEMMYGREMFVDPEAVMDLVAASTLTAYDCEFVALAIELGAPLVTTDKQILRDFPQVARPLT